LRAVTIAGDQENPLHAVLDVKTTLQEALDKAYAATECHTNGHALPSPT
jgi:hypothetical protein